MTDSPTCNSCFSNVVELSLLESIRVELLCRFLSAFEVELRARGIDLKGASADERWLEDLHAALNDPKNPPSTALIEAFAQVTAVACEDVADEVRAIAREKRVSLAIPGHQPTDAEVAVILFIEQHQRALERLASRLPRPEERRAHSSTDFQAAVVRDLPADLNSRIDVICRDVSAWAIGLGRSQYCRPRIWQLPDAVHVEILYSGAARRGGLIVDGGARRVIDGWEECRVAHIEYRPSTGRLGLRGERSVQEILRQKFGLRVFGDEHHFPMVPLYSCDPYFCEGVDSLRVEDFPVFARVSLTRLAIRRDDGITISYQHARQDFFTEARESARDAMPGIGLITAYRLRFHPVGDAPFSATIMGRQRLECPRRWREVVHAFLVARSYMNPRAALPIVAYEEASA